MPDHKRGFVRRKEGVLPSNRVMSNVYRQQASAEAVQFDAAIQRLLIEEVLVACEKQNYEAHCAATDITHLHALVCWRSERGWMQIRTSLKSSLTRRLNRENGRQAWFSEGASRKRVKDREHFKYLVGTYLPKHSGWKWTPKRGFFK